VGKTPLTLYWKARSTSPPSTEDVPDKYALHRQLTLYTFDTLGEIAAQHSPKFVFVHVLAPHPPFLFGEDGEDTSPRELPYFSTDGSYYQDYYGLTADYLRGYRRQCTFISKLAERAIDDILKNSPEPPIIIVQGDHGPGSRWNCNSSDPRDSDLKERMSILNAYYLPGAGSEGLYDGITPVNSFRLVLNNYFGANLELLPDESYLSSVKQPLLFVNVSPLVRPAPGSSPAKNPSSAATRAAP
jgi:hypothetical protein